ncbi:aldo-keto reductase [Trichoderma harzianum]|uniref:Aldo-keto reductase n=1 Tax=Trichoderma harzianum TaxID=5544 RepID=A0A0F9XBI7_TRIHA|nr:aldo-keto reductase [Trichoderma harzianum]
MELPQAFSLNNGYNVPAIGLGTFQGDQGNSKVKDAVKRALHLGYRHIDGASAYGNEKEIGEAIKESGIPRQEIFVTSKLAQTWHEPADVQKALELSLSDLQLDYETWQAMERLVDLGLARSIGLSNFNILKTKRILDIAKIIPAVNQIEIHPYLPQQELFEFSSKHGILLMAHQPLGGRPVEVVRGSNEPFPTADLKARIRLLILGGTKGNSSGPEIGADRLSSQRGSVRFLDPSRHLGFDIFDEDNDQPVADSAPWDV